MTVQVRAFRGDGGLTAGDRRGVHQPQQLRGAGGVVGQLVLALGKLISARLSPDRGGGMFMS